ncbi:MAG: ABC transporter ATP-binding protein [Clostridia bacterium]|nr:ABC transporter ATP-binding protein [Clostridia bacterium]
MIEIKNLYKSYGQNRVYENFNLSIEEGKVTCILGESGSGKTTLLNCIARLTDFNGEIPALKCSYVFQSPRLVPNLTVFKNLSLVLNDGAKITEILKKVRLTEKADEYPCNLSGGQAQRVGLARAFLVKSDIILLDEPFASLDLKLKTEMEKLFFEIRQADNRTALFVTHDVDEAITVADRVIVLKNGSVVFDCLKGENDEALRKALINALING